MSDILNAFNNLNISPKNYKPEQINQLLDLTLLKSNASNADITKTYTSAGAINAAAICLYPAYFAQIPAATNIKKATVVNFPAGNSSISVVKHEILTAIEHYNIDEIDYVFPYQMYPQSPKSAFEHASKIINYCHANQLLIKIIIETSAWNNLEDIFNVSQKLGKLGADFIKTSTGKSSSGASLDSAYAILLALKKIGTQTGLKVSGGIRTYSSASKYINLAETILQRSAKSSWLRIGTSGLTD